MTPSLPAISSAHASALLLRRPHTPPPNQRKRRLLPPFPFLTPLTLGLAIGLLDLILGERLLGDLAPAPLDRARRRRRSGSSRFLPGPRPGDCDPRLPRGRARAGPPAGKLEADRREPDHQPHLSDRAEQD